VTVGNGWKGRLGRGPDELLEGAFPLPITPMASFRFSLSAGTLFTLPLRTGLSVTPPKVRTGVVSACRVDAVHKLFMFCIPHPLETGLEGGFICTSLGSKSVAADGGFCGRFLGTNAMLGGRVMLLAFTKSR